MSKYVRLVGQWTSHTQKTYRTSDRPPSACLPSSVSPRTATGNLRVEASGAYEGRRTLSQDSADRFSGEPFRIRDIQLDYPQVGVRTQTTLNILIRVCLIRVRGGPARRHPITALIVGDTLEKAGFPAMIKALDEDGTTCRIAPVQDHGEAADRLDTPHQRARQDMAGEPFSHRRKEGGRWCSREARTAERPNA